MGKTVNLWGEKKKKKEEKQLGFGCSVRLRVDSKKCNCNKHFINSLFIERLWVACCHGLTQFQYIRLALVLLQVFCLFCFSQRLPLCLTSVRS